MSTQRRKKAHFCLNCFKTSFSYPDNLKLQQKKNETFVSSCILSQPGYELVLSLIWDTQTPSQAENELVLIKNMSSERLQIVKFSSIWYPYHSVQPKLWPNLYRPRKTTYKFSWLESILKLGFWKGNNLNQKGAKILRNNSWER